jgi:hypothetical protein
MRTKAFQTPLDVSPFGESGKAVYAYNCSSFGSQGVTKCEGIFALGTRSSNGEIRPLFAGVWARFGILKRIAAPVGTPFA